MANNKWDIVHDCDNDEGNPTCWAKEINHPIYGRFVWIEANGGGQFDVTVDRGEPATCKLSQVPKDGWQAIYSKTSEEEKGN